MMRYDDLQAGKYSNLEDLVFFYAMETKNSVVQASTFLYALFAVSLKVKINDKIRVLTAMHQVLLI